MTVTRAEAVARIASGRAPVLCVDTSAILDVVRSCHRDGLGAAHTEAVKRLAVAASAARPKLFVVGCAQVSREFDENVAAVVREAERALQRTVEAMARAVDVGRAVGVRARPVSLASADVVAGCARLASAFLHSAVSLADDDEVVLRAHRRLIAATAPASKGKQSYEDCVVVEHYLGLAAGLRRAGFERPIVFLSSNTRDYGDPDRPSVIHPDLKPDFQRLGVEFAVNLPMARTRLAPPRAVDPC